MADDNYQQSRKMVRNSPELIVSPSKHIFENFDEFILKDTKNGVGFRCSEEKNC